MTSYTSTDISTEFTALSTMLANETTSLAGKRVAEMSKTFKNFGFTNEQIATAIIQFYTNSYAVDMDTITKLTLSSLDSQVKSDILVAEQDKIIADKKEVYYRNNLTKIQMSTEESKKFLANKQLSLIHEQLISEKVKQAQIKRDMYSLDDGLKVKKAEYKANVTAFAVNSGNTEAQGLISELNQNIDALIPHTTGSASSLITGITSTPAFSEPIYTTVPAVPTES